MINRPDPQMMRSKAIKRFDHFQWMTFMLALLVFSCTDSFSSELSINNLFHGVTQDVYPFDLDGMEEVNLIGKLPDGRIFSSTETGDIYLFDGGSWNLLPHKKLPLQTTLSFVDSFDVMWIGGEGFFGYLDPNFDFIDLSSELLEEKIVSNLPIDWIHETDGWLHFASLKAFYHFDRSTQTIQITEFDAMFSGYNWKEGDALFLSGETDIKVWKTDHFETHLEWKHEYPAFLGWFHEGKEYYLTAFKLYVYENGELVETVKDKLMKFRGADHIKTNDGVIIFTYGGILKMEFNGKCSGFFSPWYHQKITAESVKMLYYFGGKDIWFLTPFASFRISLTEGVRTLSLDHGYPLSGCWDIETMNGKLFTSSLTGFQEWKPAEGKFLASGDSPDFESYSLWKQFDRVLVSTPVEIGDYQNEYRIGPSDGSYRIFAKSSLSDSFWVSMDSEIQRLNKDFEKITTISGVLGESTSLVEYENKIWVTTNKEEIVSIEIDEPNRMTDLQPDFSDQTIKNGKFFKLNGQLFFQYADSLLQRKKNLWIEIKKFNEDGWKWEIPFYSNENDQVYLLQRNETQGGCKLGQLIIDGDNQLSWNYCYLPIQAGRNSIRNIKPLPEMDGQVVAIISSSALELFDLNRFATIQTDVSSPRFVIPISKIGIIEHEQNVEEYRYNSDIPLEIQLFSPEDTSTRSISYMGRLISHNKDWEENTNGTFKYYGLLRGEYVFEGYSVDSYGNKSDVVSRKIKVIPLWYMTNTAFLLYALLFVLTVIIFSKLQNIRLAKRAKLLEQTVADRTEDLIQANRAKSIFVSNVSHEIRNPMNGLLGLAQSLKVGQTIDEETLQRLRRPSFYLYRFLSNVLDFSKFETGGIRLSKQVFNGKELLSSLDAMFAGEIDRRKLTFSADFRYNESQFIISSQEAIEMILINLVGNAIKYTPEGGAVRVAIVQEGKRLLLAVSDTGIGIPKDEQTRIFQPFEQGQQRSLISGEKGAGIGLSLVSNTLDQLGGSIWVASEPNQGSKFYASLPITLSKEATVEGDIDKIALQGHFLILEDLEYNLKLFKEMLLDWGGTVDTAMLGNEAVKLSSENQYDVIFLDYDLPDINGPEVATKIRQSNLNSDTTIIGLSAYTDHDFISESLGAGMNDFLFKPVNAHKVVECIKKFQPERIHFSLKPIDESFGTRTSLTKIRGMSERSKRNIDESIDSYIETLSELVEKLNMSDVGSTEFESLIHQLKGHCSFINHQPSIQYWQNLMRLSRSNNRMEIMDELDSLPSRIQLLRAQLSGLKDLETDFEAIKREFTHH